MVFRTRKRQVEDSMDGWCRMLWFIPDHSNNLKHADSPCPSEEQVQSCWWNLSRSTCLWTFLGMQWNMILVWHPDMEPKGPKSVNKNQQNLQRSRLYMVNGLNRLSSTSWDFSNCLQDLKVLKRSLKDLKSEETKTGKLSWSSASWRGMLLCWWSLKWKLTLCFHFFSEPTLKAPKIKVQNFDVCDMNLAQLLGASVRCGCQHRDLLWFRHHRRPSPFRRAQSQGPKLVRVLRWHDNELVSPCFNLQLFQE